MVDQHVRDHGDDPQKSLAVVSSISNICEELKAVADADVQASLGLFSNDFEKTAPHVPACTDDREGSRYRILRPHARGGLGEVFVARDTELNREIALKEIQSGKDRGDSRARFVFEAEITGGLEHPGIVPVYGLGHYSDGRPYYAMRFIRGDNLGDAIKRFHQSPPDATGGFDSIDFRRLLQRFIDVCNAIAYAHSRGVLHRDLKPGNIMLGKYVETLVVDWGLAKVGAGKVPHRLEHEGETTLAPSSGTDVLPTEYGSILGTPAYMSPEQAEGKLDQLGPASDVYSLGATLYHLLVGKPANSDCDAIEMLARSQKGEIPPPRSVNQAIPKMLDAVCKKAIELKPIDRYSSAQDLAMDLEHCLADESIRALAESFTDRARRWMRKHRTLATSTALLSLATIVAMAVGLAALEQQRRKTVEQERKTAKALVLADDRFDLALNAFKEMVFGVQDLLENRAGTIELRKELLAKARPGLEKLLKEAEAARGADRTLMGSYQRLGDVALAMGDTAMAQQEFSQFHDRAEARAAADPKNAEAQHDLSVSFSRLGDVSEQIGNPREALEYYREALEVSERLAAADPKNARTQLDLSSWYNRLGDVTLQMGNAQGALEYYRKSLEVRERLAAAEPKNSRAQGDLSSSFKKVGDVTLRLGNARAARVLPQGPGGLRAAGCGRPQKCQGPTPGPAHIKSH